MVGDQALPPARGVPKHEVFSSPRVLIDDLSRMASLLSFHRVRPAEAHSFATSHQRRVPPARPQGRGGGTTPATVKEVSTTAAARAGDCAR